MAAIGHVSHRMWTWAGDRGATVRHGEWTVTMATSLRADVVVWVMVEAQGVACPPFAGERHYRLAVPVSEQLLSGSDDGAA